MERALVKDSLKVFFRFKLELEEEEAEISASEVSNNRSMLQEKVYQSPSILDSWVSYSPYECELVFLN